MNINEQKAIEARERTEKRKNERIKVLCYLIDRDTRLDGCLKDYLKEKIKNNELRNEESINRAKKRYERVTELYQIVDQEKELNNSLKEKLKEKIKNNEIKEAYILINLINTIKIKNIKRELFPIIHKLSSPEEIKNKLKKDIARGEITNQRDLFNKLTEYKMIEKAKEEERYKKELFLIVDSRNIKQSTKSQLKYGIEYNNFRNEDDLKLIINLCKIIETKTLDPTFKDYLTNEVIFGNLRSKNKLTDMIYEKENEEKMIKEELISYLESLDISGILKIRLRSKIEQSEILDENVLDNSIKQYKERSKNRATGTYARSEGYYGRNYSPLGGWER